MFLAGLHNFKERRVKALNESEHAVHLKTMFETPSELGTESRRELKLL